MKRLGTTLLIVAVLGCLGLLQAPSASQESPSRFEVDPVHSAVLFRIKHLDVGYTYGRFNEFSGQIGFAKSGSGSSVTMEVKAASVDTADEKRDNHLRSQDFFSVREYPVIRFESSSFRKVGEKTYEVAGTLELHGKSKEITAEVGLTGEGDRGKLGYRVGFETEIDIKRSDFGMNKWLEAVGDDVRLIIAVEAVRQ